MTRLMAVHALCALILVAGTSCSADVEPCQHVEGDYYTTYTPVPSTISAPPGYGCNIGPYILPVANAPNAIITVKHLDKEIENDVRKKGCQIGMNVTVREPGTGVTTTFIHGDVAVVNAARLTGMVAGTLFDASGQAACTAQYRADMVRRDVMLQQQAAQQPAQPAPNSFGNATAGMGATAQPVTAQPAPAPAPPPVPQP